MKKKYIVLISWILLTGCAVRNNNINIEDKHSINDKLDKIEYSYKLKKANELSDGSININDSTNLMEESKYDLKIGDTILIKINERLSAQTRNNNTLNKQSTNNINGGAITSANAGMQGFLDKTINPYSSIGINSGSKQNFVGNANNTMKETFNAKITALVTEKISKYLYKIEAKKNININNEKKTMLLSGYIHVSNLGNNNVIDSSKILNLNIDYVTSGDITDTTNKGAIKRLIDKLF